MFSLVRDLPCLVAAAYGLPNPDGSKHVGTVRECN
jgi:hypothetical protein